MMMKNSSEAYGWVSIAIHWLMALVVMGLFGLGVYMVDLTYLDSDYKTAPYLHQSLGMLMLMLLVFRLFWRLLNPLPRITGAPIEKILALMVHRTHYLFLATLMLSGYLMVTADGRGVAVWSWFEVPALLVAEKGRETWAGLLHMYMAWSMMGLVLLHAAAALKHHFVDKDATLLRMLGIPKE